MCARQVPDFELLPLDSGEAITLHALLAQV
jgi:hypothetical protein